VNLAVVGHVEWAEVLRVERLPGPGGWVEATDLRVEIAGAGAAASQQLAKLAGSAAFFTVLADDERGHEAGARLREQGVEVHSTYRAGVPQRRAFVHTDARAERTITVHGPKLCPSAADPLPWPDLASCDGVCFVCGDRGALEAARRARVLVATARWLPVLKEAGVRLDALVQSGHDPDERFRAGDIDPPPRLVVTTAGSDGGSYAVDGGPEVRYEPAELEGPLVGSYAAGDSYIAGLTFALARGDDAAAAIAFAARCGAACLTGEGLSGQLRLVPGDRRGA
jgi:ribokinase